MTQPQLFEDQPKRKRKAKSPEKKTASTAVAIHEPKPTPRTKPGSAHEMLVFIGQAAKDKTVSTEKMRELLAIRSQLKAEEALESFNRDYAKMRDELDTLRITKGGRIEITAKGTDRIIQKTPYARYEDLQAVIRPILGRHHFKMMHKNGATPEGKVIVTSDLRHSEGHVETSIFIGEADPSGSKNNVQGRGSTISYGKRYNTVSLLDLVAEGEDDDGSLAKNAPVNAEQLNQLLEALDFKGIAAESFCKTARIEKVADLPARRYHEAMNWIRQVAQPKEAE